MSISSREDIAPSRIGSNWTFLGAELPPEWESSAGRFDMVEIKL